jgi:hypothetical protein
MRSSARLATAARVSSVDPSSTTMTCITRATLGQHAAQCPAEECTAIARGDHDRHRGHAPLFRLARPRCLND